jgi:hypothetical protein
VSVYVGVPCYGPVEPSFVKSLCETLLVCREAGIAVELDLVSNCSLIAKARNEIAGRFLASDFDDLFYIDADIAFQAQDFVRILQRTEPVVGGTYRAKTANVRYLIEPVVPIERNDGLLKVSAIGTGFLRIKRAVLEGMAPRMERYGDTVSFFNVGIRDGVYYGEDYAFCQDYGGEIWAYPCDLKHIGRTEYSGYFDEWVEWHGNRNGSDQQSLAADRQAGGWPNTIRC